MKIRAQCQRRLTEHQARLDVVQRSTRLGTTRASAALGMSARTLRHWRRQQRTEQLAPAVRGRPATACEVEVRNQVIRFLHRVTGPSVGLPALRCLFPKIPRCVLGELLTRYHRVWRRRYAPWGFRLTWHHAGRVWAMDHSEAYQPVDGTYPTATTRFEKRNIATEIPVWEPDACIQCAQCSLVCPHAAIRVKRYDPAELDNAPETFKSIDARGRQFAGVQRDLAAEGVPLMPVEEMEKAYNHQLKVPSFAASAVTGQNVNATLKECLVRTLISLKKEAGW